MNKGVHALFCLFKKELYLLFLQCNYLTALRHKYKSNSRFFISYPMVEKKGVDTVTNRL